MSRNILTVGDCLRSKSACKLASQALSVVREDNSPSKPLQSPLCDLTGSLEADVENWQSVFYH